jgi:hypothetical protein
MFMLIDFEPVPSFFSSRCGFADFCWVSVEFIEFIWKGEPVWLYQQTQVLRLHFSCFKQRQNFVESFFVAEKHCIPQFF